MTSVETLASIVDKLPESKRGFARSLLQQSRRRTLSDAQMLWVGKLVTLATEGPQQREIKPVGDVAGIVALFDKARQHLKSPKIVLVLPDGLQVRLAVAGERARVPGSINVNDMGRYPDGRWFGRILSSGAFEVSPREATPAGLLDQLQALSRDPVGVASAFGRLTGRCCFCNSGLKDERSTAVGYGPVCAANFGLVWGSK